TSLTDRPDARRSTRSMATPPRRALLYGGLLLHTILSAATYLWAKSALREIPPLPLGLMRFCGASVCLAALLFRLRPPGRPLPRGPLVGDLLLFVAVLAWAVYTAEGRGLVTEHGPVPTIAWTLIGGTLLYLPIGLASLAVPDALQRIAHASAAAWVGVAYLVVVTSVVAYLLCYWALAHLPAARVVVFSNLQPPATAVLAHFLLGEPVTPQF